VRGAPAARRGAPGGRDEPERMSVPEANEYFLDPRRCIGCNACVQACTECDTHKGYSMMQLDYVDAVASPQTVPVVCMHCDSPTCAEVCPADAIKRTGDGVVQSARKPRCIACNNCVLACPFGVPKMHTGMHLMMKCDLCYDRTSVGKKPMCCSVCPSQALFFGTRDEVERLRPGSRVVNAFQFGNQTITTKVNLLVPARAAVDLLDVVAAIGEPAIGNHLEDDLLLSAMVKP
jgi:Fe-S-cluster-containing dehydrogenase component